MEWTRTPLPADVATILTTAARTRRTSVTVHSIQQLTYATELVRTHGVRGESTPIAWHRKLPILASTWDSDWWSITGARLATFRDRATATWSANGLRFLVQDVHPGTTAQLDDFDTGQRYHLTVPPDTDLLLNPRFPLLVLGRSAAIEEWQIGTSHRVPFQDAQRRASWGHSWGWSPDGTILTQAAPESEGPGSASDRTRMDFWSHHGHLLATHTHPLPRPGTWHWRPDSGIVLSCHRTHLCWWDRTGTLLKHVEVGDRAVGSFHDDQYVAWSPDGRTAAVLGDREVLLFDAYGAFLRAYPLPFDCGGSCLVWHPSGSMLSVGDWSSSIHTWAVDGTLLHSLPTWERLSGFRVPFMLRWSADGSCLAVSSRDCSLYLYTLPPSTS